jgi:hypothetical protein
VVFWTQMDSPPRHDRTQHPCVGCHEITHDGTKMALTVGGSDPSDFALIDIASKTPIAVRNTDPAGFGTMSTFSSDGSRIITMLRGRLTLRTADATLNPIATLFETGVEDPQLTHAFWSADGAHLAFIGYRADGSAHSTNGDLTARGQLYVTDATVNGFGTPRVLVPRSDNGNTYYPAISDDSLWVVFNRSVCGGANNPGPYGQGPCDGYNDLTARLWLVPFAGGNPLDLTRMNGTEAWTNSWARWAPGHGTFRGRSLYWLTFSSKRPYGMRLPGSTDGSTKPQIWLGAVSIDTSSQSSEFGQGLTLTGDPSSAPIWLPGQDTDMANPSGNHVPQWVVKAVDINPG